jgi:hypothetical protein
MCQLSPENSQKPKGPARDHPNPRPRLASKLAKRKKDAYLGGPERRLRREPITSAPFHTSKIKRP